MRVVVTGASGHVGAALVRLLLARGDRVRVLAHGATHNPAALEGLDVEVAHGDVLDRAALVRAFDGAELVFHLAALISIDGDQGGLVHRVNVEGARNAAAASLAVGVRRHIHMSSVHAFDLSVTGAPLDESSPRPGPRHPAYDRSKAAGEAAVRTVIDAGLDAVIVNPSGVIGPFDFGPSRLGHMLLSTAQGRLPTVPGGGFDWVDVRDVVRTVIAAVDKARTGVNYLLPGHHRTCVEIARMAARVTGVPAPRFVMPPWLEDLAAAGIASWSRLSGSRPSFTPEAAQTLRGVQHVDGQRAASELGHQARPFEDTIADTYRWFAEAGWLPKLRERLGAATRPM